MDVDTVRLGLGAFAVSPGFGGLGALAAAVVAYLGIRHKADQDRLAAREANTAEQATQRLADERERWWELARWVDQQVVDQQVAAARRPRRRAAHRPRGGRPRPPAEEDGVLAALLDTLRAMKGSAHTEEQQAMLAAVTSKIIQAGSETRE